MSASLLEERYRRALRLLPAGYRREWADDMVATFMARAYRSMPDDPEGVEISSPRWGEVASVVVLAVRVRLGGRGARPRELAVGEAVRRVALVGLLAQVMFAYAGMLLGISSSESVDYVGFQGRWQVYFGMVGLLWLPAYLALLFGHRRAGMIIAVIAYLPGLVAGILQVRADQWAHTPYQIGWLIFEALPLAALAAFHDGAPRVRARPWVLAVPVGVGLLFAAASVDPFRATGTTLWGLAITVAGLVAIVASKRRPAMSATWPLALALLSAAVLALQLTVALDFGEVDPTGVGVVVVGVALAVTAARGLRRADLVTEPR